MAYSLVVGDNFYPGSDPGHELEVGTYSTAEEAIAAANQVVDESLEVCFSLGMDMEAPIYNFTAFGEVTYIVAGIEDAKAILDPWACTTERAAMISDPPPNQPSSPSIQPS